MKSKIFVIVFVLAVLFAGFADAAKPVITADKTYFDVNTGLYVLDGNVRVEVRDRLITAAHAKVSVSSMEVWGTGGIYFKQGDINFTGGSVYVYGTKKYAKIDGGVDYSTSGLSIIADRGEYNWGTKIANFEGNVKITQDGEIREADSAAFNVETNSFI